MPTDTALIAGRAGKKRRHRSGLDVGREFRVYSDRGMECRTAADGSDAIEIIGMPIVYNTPYSVFDYFGEFEERMLPGVADEVLAAGADVRFLFNHDGLPLARTLSGTLTVAGEDRGVGMVAKLDARQSLANDLAVAIERGDVNQMSCGFRVARDTWNDAMTERQISKLADLSDVSAVTYPASPTTSIELQLRSMMGAPVESRARVRKLWTISKDLRSGKELTAETAAALQDSLEALSDEAETDVASIFDEIPETPDGPETPAADEIEPEIVGAGVRFAKPSTADERRVAAETWYDDVQSALNTSLQQSYGGDDGDDWYDMWIVDCSDTTVVWQSYGDAGPGVGMWQQDYTLDSAGVATLTGDPVEVTVETNYVAVARSAEEPVAVSMVALELEAEIRRLRGRRRHPAA